MIAFLILCIAIGLFLSVRLAIWLGLTVLVIVPAIGMLVSGIFMLVMFAWDPGAPDSYSPKPLSERQAITSIMAGFSPTGAVKYPEDLSNPNLPLSDIECEKRSDYGPDTWGCTVHTRYTWHDLPSGCYQFIHDVNLPDSLIVYDRVKCF